MLAKHYKQAFLHPCVGQTLANSASKSFCTLHTRMCYYDILGIKAGATAAEIKSAYYEKVKKFHPDTNQTSSAEENFKIIARAYEVLRDPSKRSVYDTDKAANKGHTSSASHSGTYDYDQSSDQGQSTRRKRTSNPGSHTAYSEFYKSYGAESDSAGEKYQYTGTWQDNYNNQRAEENMRQKYYQAAQADQRNASFFNSIIVRIGMVVGLFLMYDIFRKQAKTESKNSDRARPDPRSLGQMDWGTHPVEVMSPEKIAEEMRKKQFRIEYHVIETHVSPEAARARRSYKKEKKIVDLDAYMERKNFKLEKSTAHY